MGLSRCMYLGRCKSRMMGPVAAGDVGAGWYVSVVIGVATTSSVLASLPTQWLGPSLAELFLVRQQPVHRSWNAHLHTARVRMLLCHGATRVRLVLNQEQLASDSWQIG
ncbi:hypothetical protein E2562_003005 [Oryza meyeriana var. granulata]|uniref:Uncharacterized protein n=1 Tax=Oryza meyeriana var. granulata TaxID=110450 RepID=A0A6G1DDU7_9ORYZ|nr:hypothetical protein E2562_003005 [Oryza meyeriana var. granulata]